MADNTRINTPVNTYRRLTPNITDNKAYGTIAIIIATVKLTSPLARKTSLGLKGLLFNIQRFFPSKDILIAEISHV